MMKSLSTSPSKAEPVCSVPVISFTEVYVDKIVVEAYIFYIIKCLENQSNN